MTANIESQLIDYIRREIVKRPTREINRETPLISSGLIDSFHLVDLSVYVEEQFNVRIDDTELNTDTFDNVAQLAGLIQQRMG